MADRIRASIQRHTIREMPVWEVAVSDGDIRLTGDFVLDWDSAIRLANLEVGRLRAARREAMRLHHSRVGKMRRHRRRTLLAALRSDGTFESALQVHLLKAFGFLPDELGLHFAFEEG